MAELKFSCPSCNQSIICDELWCGHQIQCPACQAEVVVPQQAAATPASAAPAPNSLVPPPPPSGASKLSIGKPQAAPTGAAHPAQKFVAALRQPAPVAKKKSSLTKLVPAVAVLIILGVGGYFGYGWFKDYQEKQEAKKRESERQAQEAEAAARQASNPNPAPEKKLPVIAPVYTLDVNAAKIPEGQANGAISGANFLVETARLDRASSGAQVLTLRQGASAVPDREILVYLHLKAGETLTNHTWTVSQDMRPPAAPQVLKLWKADARFAPQTKSFSTGYAMKLELGSAAASGEIPGKIFLALPDPEQTVVAGLFTIQPVSVDPNAQSAAPAGVSPAGTPTSPGGPGRAAFDKRYGIKR